ncbi:fimbrial protein [Pantoea sp. SO10]|uniref:fimbrial protein n=1 Tax=Pantoea sp. SO10 TaxID=2575375 RepID=UPI0010C9C63C|nr:fimbrial protein [Pantoea sp. SO10]QCP59346.1 fimbrial protein [Pantoea sp. SO10]
MSMRLSLLRLFILGLVMQSWGGYAQTDTAPLTVMINIIPPECTVNNGQQIDIDFGAQVVTTEIDGINYKQPIPANIDCKGYVNTMRLKFQGVGSPFDGELLKTSNDALGIRFLRPDGHALPLNNWLDYSFFSVPALNAVLVKDNNQILLPGDFTATAMLVIEII